MIVSKLHDLLTDLQTSATSFFMTSLVATLTASTVRDLNFIPVSGYQRCDAQMYCVLSDMKLQHTPTSVLHNFKATAHTVAL